MTKNKAIVYVCLTLLAAFSIAKGQVISFQHHHPINIVEQMLGFSSVGHNCHADDLFDCSQSGISQTNTLLSVGCTPMQTLHKSVTRGENETMLSIHVSQTCAEGNAPIKSPKVYVEAGNIIVTADGLPAQRFPLGPRDDYDHVSANYEQATNILKVTIPIKSPEARQISIETIPIPPSIAHEPTSAEEPQHAIAQEAKAIEEEKKREEFVRSSVETLERELERIKGHINSPPSPPKGPKSEF